MIEYSMGQVEYAWTDGCKLADLNSIGTTIADCYLHEISRKLRFSEIGASLRLF